MARSGRHPHRDAVLGRQSTPEELDYLEEDRQKSREAGFDGHIVKPVDHAALTKLLGPS
ncbi:MAG: DUF924 family protein [Chromatiales bacterium]